MADKENNRADYDMDNDIILPDDYEPDMDIFAQSEDSPTTDETGEGESNSSDQGEHTSTDETGGESSSENDTAADTEEESADEHGSEEGESLDNTDEGQPTTAPDKQKIKVRFNHEDIELTAEQAATLAQKGLNYDKAIERLQKSEALSNKAADFAKELGYESADAMFEATRNSIKEQRIQKYVNDDSMSEPLAKFLVESEMEKEEKAAKAARKAETQVPEAATPTTGKSALDDDIAAFVKAFPGVTELPKEVVDAVKAGVNITAAYTAYKNKLANAETDKAKAEARILKQNQAAAEKAPVSGVSKHGRASGVQKKDAFAEGFDSDVW